MLLGQATDRTNAMRTRDGCGGDKRRREDVTDAEETSDGPTDAASGPRQVTDACGGAQRGGLIAYSSDAPILLDFSACTCLALSDRIKAKRLRPTFRF